jgi:hypothetical protein
MPVDSDNHSVLLPPAPMEGGLIKMPKKNPNSEDHQFKVPLPLGNFMAKSPQII